MINACKLHHVENIWNLAIFIQETKNQTVEPPDLIEINAIIAYDLKKIQEDVKDHDLKKHQEDIKNKKNLENQQL